MHTAIKVVPTKMANVFMPIEERRDISLRSATPLISDARIRGTAINFKAFMKIVPKGLMYWEINPFPQWKLRRSSANRIPAAIPRRICQCSASFFVFKLKRY